MRDRHEDDEEFRQWANTILQEFDSYESQLNGCNGAICRNTVLAKAFLRWQKAKKDLKRVNLFLYKVLIMMTTRTFSFLIYQIDPDDLLRHELDNELKDCGF